MKECDINNFIQSSALVRALAKLPQQQPEPLICNCFIIRVTNTRLYPSFSHPDISSPVGLGASSNPKFSLRGVNGCSQEHPVATATHPTSPGTALPHDIGMGSLRYIKLSQSSCPPKSRAALAFRRRECTEGDDLMSVGPCTRSPGLD